MQGKLKILSIDPGLCCTGWSILEASIVVKYEQGVNPVGFQKSSLMTSSIKVIALGYVKTKSHSPLIERLSLISEELRKVFYSNPCFDIVIVENTIMGGRNFKAQQLLAHARGAILLTLKNLPSFGLLEIHANTVKATLCKLGNAKKDDAIKKALELVNYQGKVKNQDALDSIAIAVAAFFRYQNSFHRVLWFKAWSSLNQSFSEVLGNG